MSFPQRCGRKEIMKLNQARHDEVIRLAQAGLSTYDIAEYMKLSQSRVCAILKHNQEKTVGMERYGQTQTINVSIRTDVLKRFHLKRNLPISQAVEEALELYINKD